MLHPGALLAKARPAHTYITPRVVRGSSTSAACCWYKCCSTFKQNILGRESLPHYSSLTLFVVFNNPTTPFYPQFPTRCCVLFACELVVVVSEQLEHSKWMRHGSMELIAPTLGFEFEVVDSVRVCRTDRHQYLNSLRQRRWTLSCFGYFSFVCKSSEANKKKYSVVNCVVRVNKYIRV